LRCSLSNVSVRIDILNFSTLMDVQQLWQTAAHIVTVRTRNFCALARILVGAAYCLLIRCVFTFSEHFVIAWYQSTTTCWVAAQLSGAHIGQHLICLSFLKMLHLSCVGSNSSGMLRNCTVWMDQYQCCGSGSVIRCLFYPWSGIRTRFFTDPGSRPDLGFRILNL
jgi:hypothetical protein